MRVGSVTDALAQAKAAFDYYNQTGFVAQRSRALTVIAQAQERTGDLAGAEASYEALLKQQSTAVIRVRSPTSMTTSAPCCFSGSSTSQRCGMRTRA